MTYDSSYRVVKGGRFLSATSQIAFPRRSEIVRLHTGAGLWVDHCSGDWQHGPWHAGAAEIIPLGRLT